MKVLLIEDTDTKAEECKSLIESIGFQCSWVSTEKEAKRIVKSKEEFALILLDMEMKKSSALDTSLERHSGIRLLNCLKINKIPTPVIIITAYWDVVDMKYLEQASLIHYFRNESYFENMDDLKQDKHKTQKTEHKIRYLKDLHPILCQRYKNYVGIVEYSKVNSIWKKNLKCLVTQCLGESTNENFAFRK